MYSCRYNAQSTVDLQPAISGREISDIPKDEVILKGWARRLAVLLKDKNTRVKLLNAFKKSDRISNALSLQEVGSLFNLQVRYDKARFVNVSIPWPEHREKFFKDPNGKLLVAYSPLYEDMDVEKIVAYNSDGEAVLLDAWEPPDVPVLVLSFEPIVRQSLENNLGQNQSNTKASGGICYPRFVALKILKISGRWPEPWWLWPIEMYMKVRLRNGYEDRLPHYYVDRINDEGWISMWRPGRWYWYYIHSTVRWWEGCSVADPGLGDPMICGDYPDYYVQKISIFEDDSHFYPNVETGSDDFWGERVVTGILPWIGELVSDPNDPRLYAGITLWKNGKAGGFFKAYYRCNYGGGK